MCVCVCVCVFVGGVTHETESEPDGLCILKNAFSHVGLNVCVCVGGLLITL